MSTASGGEAIGRRHGVNRRPSGCVLTPQGRRPYEEGDGLTQTPGMCAHRGGRGGTRQKAVSASEERDLGGGDQSLDFDLGLPASKCDKNNFLCLSRPSKHTRQQRVGDGGAKWPGHVGDSQAFVKLTSSQVPAALPLENALVRGGRTAVSGQ